LRIKRALGWMSLATVAAICGGCRGAVSTRHTIPAAEKLVVLSATKEELLQKYNEMARDVKSVNATAELQPTAGSKYSGVIEEYHEVKAFLLAQRPAEIRMIGQAPVIGKTIFDMTSDGQEFRVWIPSKNKFLVGETGAERSSTKPLENLRPQHLLDAVLWPEVRKEEPVLFEEFNDETGRYYVLTVLRGGYEMEILRKIWFDRADLNVSRLESYGPKGTLLSDIHFSDWEPVEGANEAPGSVATFPRSIRIDRPHDDYQLSMEFTKLALNQDIPTDRFELQQPAGSELVRVGNESTAKPADAEAKP
jgi:outer membrane lipoprotein-sorting protein